MGQAKQRGTFEQRQTEAFIREAKHQELKRLEQEREKVALAERKEKQRLHDLKNPEQAAARQSRSRRTAMLMAAILGTSAMGVTRTTSSKGD